MEPTIFDKIVISGEIKDTHQLFEEYSNILPYWIKYEISRETPLSSLLQYAIDVASDEFISEEFYQKYDNVMAFLSVSGTTNMELQFRTYVNAHSEIFLCKEPACDGKLVGGCPKMQCDKCGRLYFINVDNITEKMCGQCIAFKIGECIVEDTEKRRKIFAGEYIG